MIFFLKARLHRTHANTFIFLLPLQLQLRNYSQIFAEIVGDYHVQIKETNINTLYATLSSIPDKTFRGQQHSQMNGEKTQYELKKSSEILHYWKDVTNETQEGQCQLHVSATVHGSLVNSIQSTFIAAQFWLSASHHCYFRKLSINGRTFYNFTQFWF